MSTDTVPLNPKPLQDKEWEMPTWPIPVSWTDAGALEREGVVLFGQKLSPPCSKIITILDAYEIKYTMHSNKPKDGYQKMPILWIGEYQINDSSIITQVLAKVLDKDFDNELEAFSTKGLMLSLEADAASKAGNMHKCGRSVGGCLGFVMGWLCCCIIPCLPLSNKMKAAYPGNSDLSMAELAEKYNTILTSKNRPFFGGDSPKMNDWSIYGIIKNFGDAGTSGFEVFVSQKELSFWFKAMQKLSMQQIEKGKNKL